MLVLEWSGEILEVLTGIESPDREIRRSLEKKFRDGCTWLRVAWVGVREPNLPVPIVVPRKIQVLEI